MNIGIDVSAAVHGRAGLGRYAHELVKALRRVAPEHTLTLFYNRAEDAIIPPEWQELPRVACDLGDKAWRALVAAAHLTGTQQDRRMGGVDVFHGTDHLLPRLRSAGSVFTIHDLTYVLYPDTHSRLNREYLRLMMPRFLRADAVVADSQSTRRDAAEWYGLPEEDVTIVYPGVSDRFSPVEPQGALALCARLGLPRDFVLCVGTIEPRKNLTVLLDALTRLEANGLAPPLVIAGRRGWLSGSFFARLEELGLERMVTILGYVSDDNLPALYSVCQTLAFPSLYEGFGLPVLEAMSCGAPVICSNSSSLPEVGGDAALYVSPQDADGWAAALTRVLGDHELRSAMRRSGLAQSAAFTWERTARSLLSVYERVGST
jgi:glycosyltransferase involved in cell wall biosynthesis